MKNKKQKYAFGNSNFRTQKLDSELCWFHLEPCKNNSFLLFAAFPPEIQKCFDLKVLKEKSGNKTAKVSGLVCFRYLGQPVVDSVEEFFEKADKQCRNIDDFFDVTLYDDKDLFGNPIPENC